MAGLHTSRLFMMPERFQATTPTATATEGLTDGAKLDANNSADKDWNGENERREKADRRTAGRTGKYERRKNRCAGCKHFDEPSEKLLGYCNYHNGDIPASAFACPMFEGA